MRGPRHDAQGELEERDPRVRVFAPGRLVAAAEHNYGSAQARGEYVARQDSDDRTYPERLRLQVALLDGRPEVGMMGGFYLVVNERRGERYVPMHLLDLDAYCAGVSLGRGRDI